MRWQLSHWMTASLRRTVLNTWGRSYWFLVIDVGGASVEARARPDAIGCRVRLHGDASPDHTSHAARLSAVASIGTQHRRVAGRAELGSEDVRVE